MYIYNNLRQATYKLLMIYIPKNIFLKGCIYLLSTVRGSRTSYNMDVSMLIRRKI